MKARKKFLMNRTEISFPRSPPLNALMKFLSFVGLPLFPVILGAIFVAAFLPEKKPRRSCFRLSASDILEFPSVRFDFTAF